MASASEGESQGNHIKILLFLLLDCKITVLMITNGLIQLINMYTLNALMLL